MKNRLNLLRSRKKPNHRNRKSRQSLQSRKQPSLKSRNSKSTPRLSRPKRKIRINIKPKVKRNNHRASSHGTVRKTAPDTYTTKVILVQTITLALWQLAGAPTTDAASTPTAASGSTSRTCTSSWERMGYGMQWHPATLL